MAKRWTCLPNEIVASSLNDIDFCVLAEVLQDIKPVTRIS